MNMVEFNINRRSFLEKVIKYGSAVPLLILAGDNLTHARGYTDVDTSGAKGDANNKPDCLFQLYTQQNRLNVKLEQLCQVYKEEYEKTETKQSVRMDSKGNLTPYTYVETVWREEDNVPDHELVYSWRDQQRVFTEKLDYLTSAPLIEEYGGINVKIENKKSNVLGQGILSLVFYGGGAALLLNYDKIADNVLSRWDVEPEQKINRRKFLKLGGAGLAALLTGKMVTKHKNSEIDRELEIRNQVSELLNDPEDLAEVEFTKYFEIMSNELEGRVNSYIQESLETISKGVENLNVQIKFNELIETGNNYKVFLNQFFENGVPEELGHTAHYGRITHGMDKLGGQGQVFKDIFSEMFTNGAILGGIVGLGEIVNSQIAKIKNE